MEQQKIQTLGAGTSEVRVLETKKKIRWDGIWVPMMPLILKPSWLSVSFLLSLGFMGWGRGD